MFWLSHLECLLSWLTQSKPSTGSQNMFSDPFAIVTRDPVACRLSRDRCQLSPLLTSPALIWWITPICLCNTPVIRRTPRQTLPKALLLDSQHQELLIKCPRAPNFSCGLISRPETPLPESPAKKNSSSLWLLARNCQHPLKWTGFGQFWRFLWCSKLWGLISKKSNNVIKIPVRQKWHTGILKPEASLHFHRASPKSSLKSLMIPISSSQVFWNCEMLLLKGFGTQLWAHQVSLISIGPQIETKSGPSINSTGDTSLHRAAWKGKYCSDMALVDAKHYLKAFWALKITSTKARLLKRDLPVRGRMPFRPAERQSFRLFEKGNSNTFWRFERSKSMPLEGQQRYLSYRTLHVAMVSRSSLVLIFAGEICKYRVICCTMGSFAQECLCRWPTLKVPRQGYRTFLAEC